MSYQIIRLYSDLSCATEHCDSITRALTAAAIYLEDPDCIMVKIYDIQAEKFVLDYDAH